jgi:hypothetical protein
MCRLVRTGCVAFADDSLMMIMLSGQSGRLRPVAHFGAGHPGVPMIGPTLGLNGHPVLAATWHPNVSSRSISNQR